MPEPQDPIYQFANLSDYSLKERMMIRLADVVFYLSIRLLGMLTRFKVEGLEHLTAIEAAGKLPIYAFWHDRLLLSAYYWRHRGIVILISKSFDGEYIARVLQRLGCGAVRGSSSRGAARGLVEMIKAMRRGLPMAFAVDGPRGPRHAVKAGPIFLAKKTGNPILPFVIEPRGSWTTKSWDKMQIPKPFSQALTIIGEPIYVDAQANEAEIDAKLTELQRSLDNLVERGRQWSGRDG